MSQIRGGKGEAVLRYCEPLPTKEMRYLTAFPKGKKHGRFFPFLNFTFGEFLKNGKFYHLAVSVLDNI
jgi:hypothetical protein